MASLSLLWYFLEPYDKIKQINKDWRNLMEVAEIRQKIVENKEKLTSFRRSL